MRFRGSRRAIALVGLAVVVSLALAPAGGAAGSDPSVRLLSPGGPVTLHREGKRVFLVGLPVWVAATGGDFELRVSRPDYDTPVGITQTDAVTGDVVRDLPEETLDGWSGLAGFLEVTVMDSTGNPVRQRSFTFCPNAWERQRVDDSGPELPRYPTFCADWLSFFTKGMVWGIDAGWASPGFTWGDTGVPTLRLPAGEYTMVVRIAGWYAELLEIPAEDAEVTLDVTVVDAPGPIGIPRPAKRTSHPRQVLGVPDVGDPDPSTLPDLVALPLWSLTAFNRNGRDYLGFAATPWNAGPAPMVVEGFRRSGESVMDAYQYFRDADGNVVGRAPVGEMAWDSRHGHHHWHFLQFASFTLRDAAQMELVRSDERHRSHRRARDVESLRHRRQHDVRFRRLVVGARGAAGRLGRYVLAARRRPGLQHHQAAERLVLRENRRESARRSLRDDDREQQRVAPPLPGWAPGPSHRPRDALARRRVLTQSDALSPRRRE
jgi:hypothetical protein